MDMRQVLIDIREQAEQGRDWYYKPDEFDPPEPRDLARILSYIYTKADDALEDV